MEDSEATLVRLLEENARLRVRNAMLKRADLRLEELALNRSIGKKDVTTDEAIAAIPAGYRLVLVQGVAGETGWGAILIDTAGNKEASGDEDTPTAAILAALKNIPLW